MLKLRAFAVVLVIALTLSGAALAQDSTVAQLIAETPNLSTLNTLVTAAGITLSGDVYAPTNDAFAAWPPFVTEYVSTTPDLLTAILNAHIGADVDSAQIVGDPVPASDGTLTIINTVLLPDITLPEVIPDDVYGDIGLAGSSTVFPITQAVSSDFAAEGYNGEITADSIGTGAGFERFCAAQGATDIANASRPIKNSEREACAANNQREPIGFLVGNDGLAVVVNLDNDWATDLTLDELALAFSTAVTWSDVRPSFPECEIQRWSPGTDSGTFDFFIEKVFESDLAPLLASSNLNQSEDDNVLLDGVAQNECAIGYFGYAYYAENTDILNLVAIDGALPTTDTVNDGSYELARPLYIYTAANVIAEKPQVGQYLLYYLNRVPDITPAVGYFLPDEAGFNASKLAAIAITAGGN